MDSVDLSRDESRPTQRLSTVPAPVPSRGEAELHDGDQPREHHDTEQRDALGGSTRARPAQGGTGPLSATELRAMWRTASKERGWSYPTDWWCPVVDAVTESVVSDGDISERCRRLGWARAAAGVPMKETLDDVLALGRLVRSLAAHPSLGAQQRTEVDIVELLQVAAEGWAEHVESDIAVTPTGADPLTQLADLSYLSVRLGEIYASAEYDGVSACEQYALVVASLLGPLEIGDTDAKQYLSRVETWDAMHQMTQLADNLKSVFASGETIVLAGPTTAVVLVRRTALLASRIGALRELLEDGRLTRTPQQSPAVGVWVEGLPASLRNARALLTELKR